jgi:ABC-type multidrug transport system ATPase subunit
MLLLDEPTIGLSPIAVTEAFHQIERVAETGVALLIVDQNAMQALRLASQVCVVSRGRVVYAGSKEQAMNELNIVDAHLGLVAADAIATRQEDEPAAALEALTSADSLTSRLRRWSSVFR